MIGQNCAQIRRASNRRCFFLLLTDLCVNWGKHLQVCLSFYVPLRLIRSLTRNVWIVGVSLISAANHAAPAQPEIHGMFIKPTYGFLSPKISLLSKPPANLPVCLFLAPIGSTIYIHFDSFRVFLCTFWPRFSAFHSE